jgi:hypothetical protein
MAVFRRPLQSRALIYYINNKAQQISICKCTVSKQRGLNVLKAFTLIFFILIAMNVCAPLAATPMDLTQFQWKNRLLFLFAPNRSHPFYKHLHRQIIDQKSEVEDRDLVIFSVLLQGPSQMNATAINRQEADSIRQRFMIPPQEFSLILIGKDGGIKLKRNDQVDLAEVFELIDSMPMRQNEMRQKNQ